MILDINEICSNFDTDLATFIHNIILVIKIAVPIVLVILGMLDLGKGVVAGKEDEIKKGQSTFVKRLIAGVMVFFMISITQLLTGIIDKDSDGDIWTCANAIMNGNGENSAMWNKKKQYELNQIKKDNPSTFQYCCESLNGSVLGDSCINSYGKEISNKELSACTSNMSNNLKSKFTDDAKACCQELGGGYTSGTCTDHNGGTISSDKVNACVVIKIKDKNPEIYKNCCEARGGHYGENSGCVDSNGGSISDTAINSCVISNFKEEE